jgi:DNA-binding phage protein
MAFRLNVARLKEIAVEHGDETPYAVAKNTGVNISSAYRILNEETQPDLISALRLSVAYDFDLRTVMDEQPAAVPAQAGAA